MMVELSRDHHSVNPETEESVAAIPLAYCMSPNRVCAALLFSDGGFSIYQLDSLVIHSRSLANRDPGTISPP